MTIGIVAALVAVTGAAAAAVFVQATPRHDGVGVAQGVVQISSSSVRGTAARLSSTPSPPSRSRTPAADFSTLYRSVGDGVIRVETTACDGGGVGSGFLIAPDLVATVAHVVDGAVSVVLRAGATTTTGTVIGIDRGHELALIRATRPLPGHLFTLSTTQPDVGTDVAAIGFPLAGQESMTKGSVSGLDRPISVPDAELTGLIQTDTAINPGNSGGPLLVLDGTVVGLVEAHTIGAENVGFAIPASVAAPALTRWRTTPRPVTTTGGCGDPTGPGEVTAVVEDHSGDPDGAGLADSFRTYAQGINTGDYQSAYDVLTPDAQSHDTLRHFSRGEASSYIVYLAIDGVTAESSADRESVEVTFTSVQDPRLGGIGQSCSDWALTYGMVFDGSRWRIDTASPHAGNPAPC